MQTITTAELVKLFDQTATLFNDRLAVDQFQANLEYAKAEYAGRNIPQDGDEDEFAEGQRFYVDDVAAGDDSERQYFATFDEALEVVTPLASTYYLVIYDQSFDGPAYYTKTGDVYSDSGMLTTCNSYREYIKKASVVAAKLNKETGEILWDVMF